MPNSDSPVFYLDSSVALRIVLNHSASAIDWFNEEYTREATMTSSRLLGLEMMRVFRREALTVDPVEDFTHRLVLLSVDDALLTEAAAIRPHIRSRDALHLASALRVGLGNITVVSHDTNMLRVSDSLGFSTLDPVER